MRLSILAFLLGVALLQMQAELFGAGVYGGLAALGALLAARPALAALPGTLWPAL